MVRTVGLSWKRKTWNSFRRLCRPVWPASLRSALARLTGGGTEILFVHSSLSNCGHFAAGPENLLGILAEFSDTLCLPTHSYFYPSSPGEAGPLFDPATTPSKVGRLTDIFRTQPGVLRSIHATHSLAASGALADEICSDHSRWDAPCGAGTPYSRLIQRRASVLMFGVSFHYYTLFHTAEFESGSEYAYEHGTLDWLRVVDENRKERDCWSRRQSRAPMRFAEAGDLLERIGLVRRIQLGRGTLLFAPDSSKVHDFLLQRLRVFPDFLRQSCTTGLH
jgi:aminoglycoside 3-N-acetyltransferase